MTRHLWVDRADIASTRVVDEPEQDLDEGQARFRIDRVAMTANNVTYAAVSGLIPYFEFFPTTESGWGRLPTWGFADVVETRSGAVAVGERLYGLWPSSTDLTMTPERRGPLVVDQAEHRRPLPPFYNQYTPTDSDPLYTVGDESLICLFRPLFLTAYAIDEWLAAEGFHGAGTIVLSSASSKTAWATAHLLTRRPGLTTIGLTSAANEDFVADLDVYGRVVPYDRLEAIDGVSRVAYIDLSGSAKVRRDLRKVCGDRLVLDLGVGLAHWSEWSGRGEYEDVPVTRFFAPSTVMERSAAIGRDAYMANAARAWEEFLPTADAGLDIEESSGIEALERAYGETVAGVVTPRRGLIVRPATG